MDQAPPHTVVIQIEQTHAEIIQQVLNVDQDENSIVKIGHNGNKLELNFSHNDAKKVRASVKHTLDQLLLVLETIEYTKK